MTSDSPQSAAVHISSDAPVADLNAPIVEDLFLGLVMAGCFGVATHMLFNLPQLWGALVGLVIGLIVGGFITLMRDNRRLRVDVKNNAFQSGKNKPYRLSDVTLIPGRVVGGKGVALFQFKVKTPGALINVASRRGAVLRKRWTDEDIRTITLLVDAVGEPEFQRTWHENWVPTLRAQAKEI